MSSNKKPVNWPKGLCNPDDLVRDGTFGPGDFACLFGNWIFFLEQGNKKIPRKASDGKLMYVKPLSTATGFSGGTAKSYLSVIAKHRFGLGIKEIDTRNKKIKIWQFVEPES